MGMDKRLPQIVPRSAGQSENKIASQPRQKRRQVVAACENCRKRKEKCDDKRPTCGACARRGVYCNNATKDDEESSTLTLRSRNAVLRQENKQLRELFALLRKMCEGDSHEVLGRLRDTDDPFAVLRDVQQAALEPTPSRSPPEESIDSQIEKIDLIALRESPFRLEAKPWTTIAGDGLVSDLVSSYFVWDNSFLTPFIEQDAFLADMRSQNLESARYCSPFLVNAICASRCYTSATAKSFCAATGRSLSDEFLEEANRHLDLEEGRVSLPTVQGLTLMYAIACYRGTDRAGQLYRIAACEMFRELDVDSAFDALRDDAADARERQVLSSVTWGLFCFESIIAYLYFELSLLPPPSMPRVFSPKFSAARHDRNIDVHGNPYTASSKSLPLVPGTLDVTCDLAMILYKSMQWNGQAPFEVGSDQDVAKRRELLGEVRQWRARINPILRDERNFNPTTFALRTYMNEVMISIVRPLDAQAVVEPGWTRKDLCLSYCRNDVENTEQFLDVYTLREYSCATLCGICNSLLLLAYHLEDPNTHDLFTRSCRLIRLTAEEYPMARFILQGIKAVAWDQDVPIPPAAMEYFENLGSSKEALRDVPLGLALPEAGNVRRSLANEGDKESSEKIVTDMGTLLAKWSAMFD